MYATVVASTNSIPTTFGTGAGSLIINGAPSGGQLAIINTTADDIIFTVTTHPTSVPADSISTNPGQYLVPAAPSGGTAANTHDRFPIPSGARVFIKAANGVVSSGKVHAVIW